MLRKFYPDACPIRCKFMLRGRTKKKKKNTVFRENSWRKMIQGVGNYCLFPTKQLHFVIPYNVSLILINSCSKFVSMNCDPTIWLTFFPMLLKNEERKKKPYQLCLFAQLFQRDTFKITVQYTTTGNRKILHSFKTHSSCDESPILHPSEPNSRQIRRSNCPFLSPLLLPSRPRA